MEQNKENKENKEGLKKLNIFQVILGIIGKTLVVLAILFVVLILIATVVSPIYTKYLESSREKQYQKELDTYMALQKADIYGGKTPEETFDLLIIALEKGDIELASKYYVLEKQEKELENFKEELAKEGDLHLSIIYFTDVSQKGEKRCHDLDDSEKAGCNFKYKYITAEDKTVGIRGRDEKVFIPKGSVRQKFIDVSINPLTNLWKITQ